MFDDLGLIIGAIIGAVGAVSAHDMRLDVLAVFCALGYTAAIFGMGYKSGSR